MNLRKQFGFKEREREKERQPDRQTDRGMFFQLLEHCCVASSGQSWYQGTPQMKHQQKDRILNGASNFHVKQKYPNEKKSHFKTFCFQCQSWSFNSDNDSLIHLWNSFPHLIQGSGSHAMIRKNVNYFFVFLIPKASEFREGGLSYLLRWYCRPRYVNPEASGRGYLRLNLETWHRRCQDRNRKETNLAASAKK